MSPTNGRYFSTHDCDNDVYDKVNGAARHNGWWYKCCFEYIFERRLQRRIEIGWPLLPSSHKWWYKEPHNIMKIISRNVFQNSHRISIWFFYLRICELMFKALPQLFDNTMCYKSRLNTVIISASQNYVAPIHQSYQDSSIGSLLNKSFN